MAADRTLSWLLLLLATGALAIGAAACGGNGGDDGGTGSPTPSPTAFVPVGCQIVWVTRDPPAQSDRIDYYVVDARVAEWTTGTHEYSQADGTGLTNVTGAFVNDYDFGTDEYGSATVATSGEFTLTLAATDPLAAGSPVDFEDLDPQEYFLIDTANNLAQSSGTSGTGSFQGVWSDPGLADVAEGTGVIDVLFMGTNLTMGSSFSYGLCYDAGSAFAETSREWRIREAGRRAGMTLR